jgi:hypothetical protein
MANHCDHLRQLDISEAEPIPSFAEKCDAVFTLPSDLPEIEVFGLLYWRFGEPNGFLSKMLASGGDPDAPWKWQYVFRLDESIKISVQRSWLALEFMVWGCRLSVDVAIEFLRYNLALHKHDIQTAIEKLEHWCLVINPFQRHAAMAHVAADELRRVEIPRIAYPPGVGCTRKESRRYINSLKEHTSAARREMFYCMSLVTESAFMAESYLNLAITLFRNDPLRKNEGLFKDIRRGRWVDKLKGLPLYCLEVEVQPDLQADAVRSAEWLFGLRNRLAHSHPDIPDLAVSEMWFNSRIPILPTAVPFDSFQLVTDRILPTRDEALHALPAATSFVDYVTSLFSSNAQNALQTAATALALGFNQKTQHYCVPFSSAVGRVFMYKEPPPSFK